MLFKWDCYNRSHYTYNTSLLVMQRYCSDCVDKWKHIKEEGNKRINKNKATAKVYYVNILQFRYHTLTKSYLFRRNKCLTWHKCSETWCKIRRGKCAFREIEFSMQFQIYGGILGATSQNFQGHFQKICFLFFWHFLTFFQSWNYPLFH